MKNKVYAVMSQSGSFEDVIVELEAIFSSRERAEKFVRDLEDEDRINKDLSQRCIKCYGKNKDCPFWIEPTDTSEDCDNYMEFAYYESINYSIKEVTMDEALK